jgi:hypothetical protein
VPDNRSTGDPPVVRPRSHGHGSDLAAVAPLAEEGHNKSLHPRRAEEEREEVVEPSHGTREG